MRTPWLAQFRRTTACQLIDLHHARGVFTIARRLVVYNTPRRVTFDWSLFSDFGRHHWPAATSATFYYFQVVFACVGEWTAFSDGRRLHRPTTSVCLLLVCRNQVILITIRFALTATELNRVGRWSTFLADRTNGRAIGTMLRLSAVTFDVEYLGNR